MLASIVGTLVSGWLADRRFKANQRRLARTLYHGTALSYTLFALSLDYGFVVFAPTPLSNKIHI